MKMPIVIAIVSAIILLLYSLLLAVACVADNILEYTQTQLFILVLMVLFPIIIALMFLIGIIKGNRLAWRWGRAVILFGAVILTLFEVPAILMLLDNSEGGILVFPLVILALPLYSTFFALGTTGAKEHFHLICPECGNRKIKGSNLVYSEVICRKCNAKWS